MTDNTIPTSDDEKVQDDVEQPTDGKQAEDVKNAAPVAPDVDEVELAAPEVEAPGAALEAELTAAKAEAKQHYDAMLRARADFTNYKKRVERERADISERAVLDVMKAVLPIIDDFERSLENVPEELKDTPWVEGTAAIERKLKKLLETYDIEPIDPVGEPFDPDKHQGLGVDESSDMESGHVTATLQKGYVKDDKVLRPALVRVAG